MVRAPFDIGEPVVDCDHENDDPNTVIIVNCPPQTADDWNAYRNTTVAEDNPDYPEDAPVAVAVYHDELVKFDPDWADHGDPFSLSELNEAGVSHYSFPAPRLKSLESDESEEDDENAEKSADTEPDEDTADTEDTDDCTDESETNPNPDSNGDGDGESNPKNEPPAAVRALKDALEDRGMSAEIEPDGHTIAAEKLGVTYHVKPGEVLDGDGPHRDKIEQIVAEV